MINVPPGAIAKVGLFKGVFPWLTKFWIAPGPLPLEICEKMPGDAVCTVTLTAALATLFTVTTTGTEPVGVAHGTWALICPEETKYSGAGRPPIVTEVPLMLVGSGTA